MNFSREYFSFRSLELYCQTEFFQTLFLGVYQAFTSFKLYALNTNHLVSRPNFLGLSSFQVYHHPAILQIKVLVPIIWCRLASSMISPLTTELPGLPGLSLSPEQFGSDCFSSVSKAVKYLLQYSDVNLMYTGAHGH